MRGYGVEGEGVEARGTGGSGSKSPGEQAWLQSTAKVRAGLHPHGWGGPKVGIRNYLG